MDHVEVKVLVPAGRLADFYKSYADWLEPGRTKSAPRKREGSRGRTSSYSLLGDHLDGQGGSAVSLGFSDIEEILGRELPASAYRHRAWWANTESHSQAAEWLQRGWKASELDLDEKRLTFKRMR